MEAAYRNTAADQFQMKENQCYNEIGRVNAVGKMYNQEPSVHSQASTKKDIQKNGDNCGSVKRRLWLVLSATVVTAVLATIISAIVLLAVSLNNIKSENSRLQLAFNQTTEELLSLENMLLTLNDSSSMLYQQNENMLNELAALQRKNFEEMVNDSVAHLQETVNDSVFELQQVLKEQFQTVSSSIENVAGQYSFFHQVSSCTSLPPHSQPGYYWIGTSSDFAVRVYCDMTRSCGGVTGGWMRVTELDMTNSGNQCPNGLMEHLFINSTKRTCVRNTSLEGCSSVVFSIENANNYTHVCGKVIGYQYGTPEAFRPHYQSESVDVDGVIMSHGPQQQHIWTFAAARGETFQTRSHLCPCIRSTANFSSIPTSNVGDDYFCDTGSSGVGEPNTFYGDDPLWDGAGCENTNTCCSFNTPPWFYKQLPQPTTDDIEMRVCRSAERDDEDIAIEMYEILVQ